VLLGRRDGGRAVFRQALVDLPMGLAELAPQLGALLSVQPVGEEELQHPFVPELAMQRLVGGQPLAQRALAVGAQLVGLAPAPVGVVTPASDQAQLLEPLQLGVDLSVARGPEEPGRDVDQLLDVVAGAPAELEHPEEEV
jgi:hypothetical protein